MSIYGVKVFMPFFFSLQKKKAQSFGHKLGYILDKWHREQCSSRSDSPETFAMIFNPQLYGYSRKICPEIRYTGLLYRNGSVNLFLECN